MKYIGGHLGALVGFLVCLTIAVVTTYLNRAAFNGAPLYIASGFVVGALCFAIPMDVKQAGETAKGIVSAVNDLRKGGG